MSTTHRTRYSGPPEMKTVSRIVQGRLGWLGRAVGRGFRAVFDSQVDNQVKRTTRPTTTNTAANTTPSTISAVRKALANT